MKTKKWIWLLTVLSFCGCTASQFTVNTTASYELPGGEKLFYSSNKNQEGFKATLGFDKDSKLRTMEVETTASTPEASIAAALQSNLEMQKQIGAMLQVLLPMMKAAATKGAVQ